MIFVPIMLLKNIMVCILAMHFYYPKAVFIYKFCLYLVLHKPRLKPLLASPDAPSRVVCDGCYLVMGFLFNSQIYVQLYF